MCVYSALAQVGAGRALNATPEERAAAQATGSGEDEVPEEFRQGLDSFFRALEAEKK